MPGRVGECVHSEEVEQVMPAPLGAFKEKKLRFEWEEKPSAEFLMNYNHRMEPNSMFVDEMDETGVTVTVRWGLMGQPDGKVREVLNQWLAKVETRTHRPSGISGRHLQ